MLNHAGRLVAHFQLNFMYPGDGKEYVTILSSKYTGWYLTVNARRRFRGAVPMNSNELFERVALVSPHFALRAVFFDFHAQNTTQTNTTQTLNTTQANTMDNDATSSGSGSGAVSGSGIGLGEEFPCHDNATPSSCTSDTNTVTMPAERRDCYLGFSADGRAACFTSTGAPEVNLVLYDARSSK